MQRGIPIMECLFSYMMCRNKKEYQAEAKELTREDKLLFCCRFC